MVGAKIFPPQAIAEAGAAFGGSYEGAPLAPDAAVAAAIAPALAAARARRDAPLGVTIAGPIAPSYDAESALGNLFTDLMRAARPKADVALTTGGSLRAELPAGALTYGQLHEALPFDDRFVTMAITGADLAALVARNLGRAGGIVSLSGVRATAACAAGALEVTLTRPDGKPVGAGERLTLVTSEFLATGGGGVFPAEVRARAGADDGRWRPIRDAMADVLRARKTPIDPANPPLYDAAHPRLAYPGRRPVRCRQARDNPRPFSRAAVQPLSLIQARHGHRAQNGRATARPDHHQGPLHRGGPGARRHLHPPAVRALLGREPGDLGRAARPHARPLARYANERFLEGLDKLRLSPARIPRLEEINQFMQPLTGFRARAVSGYVPSYVFFDCLRRREFPTTITIRDGAQPGIPARARHLPRRRRPRADAHRSRVRAGAGPLRRLRGGGGAPRVGDRRRAREAAHR